MKRAPRSRPVNQDTSTAPFCPAILSTTLRSSLPGAPLERARSPFPRRSATAKLVLALSAFANKEPQHTEAPRFRTRLP
jgi:hypothetical protein